MVDFKKLLGVFKIDSIIEDLIAIVEAKVELLKIELKEEAAKVAAKIIWIVVLSILVFLIVIFFSFSIATVINEILNSRFWGYAIVTSFYLLLLIGFKVFKIGDRIERKIEESLSKLKSEDKEEIDE